MAYPPAWGAGAEEARGREGAVVAVVAAGAAALVLLRHEAAAGFRSSYDRLGFRQWYRFRIGSGVAVRSSACFYARRNFSVGPVQCLSVLACAFNL